MSKKLRIEVQRDTIAFVNKNKSKFKSKVIKYGNNLPMIPIAKETFDTNITVEPIDTLEAVTNAIESGMTKVGFLVFANATNPGGRYAEGTPAQEESICRRTNLVSCFQQMMFPIPEFGSNYVGNIGIVRDTENNNYKYFNKIITADCVLSAAYHGPPTESEDKLTPEYRLKTKNKILSVLNAFLENNNYNIVLGAYGCGAFGNPVEDIANIFKEVLESPQYKNRFSNVIFAVMKDVGKHNYLTFCNVFC